MASQKQLRLVLVTPEKTLMDEPVESLRFPLFDGQIGVLPGRAPLVGRLGEGELHIERDSDSLSYFIDGGFVQIKGEVVTLLTNRAIPTSQLTSQAADAALTAAFALKPTSEVEFAAKEKAVRRARQMLTLAKKPR